MVQAAPLAGIPAWIVVCIVYANSYASVAVYFASRLFMLAAGLLAAVPARVIARSDFVRAQASGSQRFHLIVAAGSLALAAALAIVFAIKRRV